MTMRQDFGPVAKAKKGKGPRGKREVRRIRAEKQTAHELANKARRRAEKSAKIEQRSTTNVKTGGRL